MKSEEIKDKLKSRKLWVTVGVAALIALFEALGLSDLAKLALAIAGGSYAVGQGNADKGKAEAAARIEIAQISAASHLRMAKFHAEQDKELNSLKKPAA